MDLFVFFTGFTCFFFTFLGGVRPVPRDEHRADASRLRVDRPAALPFRPGKWIFRFDPIRFCFMIVAGPLDSWRRKLVSK